MSVSRYCQLVIIFRLVSGAPSTKIAYRLVPGLQLQAKLVRGNERLKSTVNWRKFVMGMLKGH
jgi:hypothetical protein